MHSQKEILLMTLNQIYGVGVRAPATAPKVAVSILAGYNNFLQIKLSSCQPVTTEKIFPGCLYFYFADAVWERERGGMRYRIRTLKPTGRFW